MTDRRLMYVFLKLRNTFGKLGIGSKYPLSYKLMSDEKYEQWINKLMGNETLLK